MDKLTKLNQEIEKSIADLSEFDMMISDKFDTLQDKYPNEISMEEMRAMTPNVWHRVNSKVRIKRISQDRDTLVFITEMKDSGEFANHFHDCVETCYVHAGILVTPLTNQETHAGESITIPADRKHKPYAIGDTTLTVILEK